MIFYEHHTESVISLKHWWKRVGHSSLMAFVLVALTLMMGVAGYHFIGGFAILMAPFLHRFFGPEKK